MALWMLYTAAIGDRPVALMAALQTAPPDPMTYLVNAGALGVIIILVVTGQLHTKATVAAKDKEIAAKDKLIEALMLQITGHTLPALAQSARAIEAASEAQQTPRLAPEDIAGIARQLAHLAKGDAE